MKSILITGGTGSLGRALIRHYLTTPVSRIAILSRDEVKQSQMARDFPNNRLRWFLGDVRDPDRLEMAFHGVDTVIHAAALKRIDAVAADPAEVIKTNIIGTQNVIEAAIRARVGRVILVSSDKAVEPINVYGSTKMCAEWITVLFNRYSFPRGTKLSVVRYGNVLGSRGSVVELWRDAVRAGWPITITDDRCTRFCITMPQAVQVIHDALELMDGGEIFVPDLPSMRLTDLAEAVAMGHPHVITDLRPGGEKLHERLINHEEIRRTIKITTTATMEGYAIVPTGQIYVILPAVRYWGGSPLHGEAVASDWTYSSDLNNQWLSVDAIRTLLRETPES